VTDRIERWRRRTLCAWASFWRSAASRDDALAIDRGSGDFLVDMGYSDPDVVRVKFALSNAIALAVERLGAARAAALAGATVDQIDAITEGRVRDVSIEDLRRIAVAVSSNL